uniref:Structural maintenance of chromosomes protein 5 n=1 Tax=Oryza glumipatula TaxID=40148 RepID=A0A0E0BKJ5_9ORYZ
MATSAARARIDSPSPPPPPTQPRRGDDDYVPCNIVEIELLNFMTYDRLACRPGPRLNLVAGPNGSGKGSLVCAIALALTADPSVLGRAASVGAFVKRGEESGHVKISLSGNTPEHIIRITRKIDTKNKSEWLLDATVPRKEVVDLIKKFNIQDNNLTQHHQLIYRSKELKNLEVANLMRKRLPWLKYEMKEEELIEAQEQEKTMKKKMEIAKIWEDSKRPIEYERILKAKEALAAAEREHDLQPYEAPKAEMTRLHVALSQIEANGNYKILQRVRCCGAEKKKSKKHTTGCKITDTSSGLKFTDLFSLRFVYMHVNIQDKAHASYLEGHVPNYIWKMQEVGIYSRLDQVFEAPPAVKDVLISRANFDHSYIGTDETHNRADDMLVSGDIERLRSHKQKHMKDIEGTGEALKMLLTTPSQLEDEAAKFHRINEEMLHEKRKQDEIKKHVGMITFAVLLDLLIRAVVLKRSCTQENMASIELDTKMPTTMGKELDCAIQGIESEANSMLFLNQNVLLEYQNWQHEVQVHRFI